MRTFEFKKKNHVKCCYCKFQSVPNSMHRQIFKVSFFGKNYAYYAFFASICNLKFKEMFLCGILLLLDFEKKNRISHYAIRIRIFAFSHFRIVRMRRIRIAFASRFRRAVAFASHSHSLFAKPSHSHRIRI